MHDADRRNITSPVRLLLGVAIAVVLALALLSVERGGGGTRLEFDPAGSEKATPTSSVTAAGQPSGGQPPGPRPKPPKCKNPPCRPPSGD